LLWLGDWLWAKTIDPLLRFLVGQDDLVALQRLRAPVQLTLLAALAVLAISPIYSPGRMLTASGLLFDIAGAVHLFLFERIEEELSKFKLNKYGNYPSVAMRELIIPEGVSQMSINDNHIGFSTTNSVACCSCS
jgi:hypothetical protein